MVRSRQYVYTNPPALSSGGVGRSGTFVAIHQTVLQAQDKAEESLDKLAFQQVVHLRQARHPWMVEGEHQFKLIASVARSILGKE